MKREFGIRLGGHRKRTGGGLQWIGKSRKRETPELEDLSMYASSPEEPSLPWYATVSFWSLVTANLVTIIWAMRAELQLSVMIWVFLCQNIILGLFWPAKVFASSPDSDYARKVKSVCTFMPQYLITNLLYGFFLYNLLQAQLISANLKSILAMAGIMFLSETLSYFVSTKQHGNKPLSLATVNLFPYARVLPMHLLVTVGIFAVASEEFAYFTVIFLLSLKMLADVTMHIVEQKKLSGFADTTPQIKRKTCRLCQRQFAHHETPIKIKNSIICQHCLKKIQLARAEAKDGK